MKYVISFSGGIGSAASALIAYRMGLHFEMVFADTLIEDDDLYRFLHDVAGAVDREIVWLRDGRDPWGIFDHKQFIGDTRRAPCSSMLKTDQVRGWMEKHCAPATHALVLGMDGGEQDRIDRAAAKWAPWRVVSLLQKFRITRPRALELLAEHGLRRPQLYEHGFPHNNCGGFCVRAGQAQFATLLERFPDRFEHHAAKERQFLVKYPRARPFMYRRVGQERVYMTMDEFRDLYQRGEIKVSPYDWGGCGCFTDAENT